MGLLGTCLGMAALLPLTNEPLQPAILIEPLTLAALLLTMVEHHVVRSSLALGIVMGTLLVIKVNIGGLLLIGLVVYQLAAYGGRWYVARGGLAGVLLASVVIVMVPLLRRAPVAEFALVYCAASGCVASAIWIARPRLPLGPLRTVPLLVGTAIGVVAEVVVAVVRGNSFLEIAEATVLRPLSQARGLYIPVAYIGPTALAVAATVAVTLLWARSSGRLGLGKQPGSSSARQYGPQLDRRPSAPTTSGSTQTEPWADPSHLLIWASLATAFAAIVGLAAGVPLLGLGCIWMAVLLPGQTVSMGASSGRVVLALLATTMIVQAYPTAGSQLGFAGFLVDLCAAVVLSGVIFELDGSHSSERSGTMSALRCSDLVGWRGSQHRAARDSGGTVSVRGPTRLLGAVVAALGVLIFLVAATYGWLQYASSPSLDLPGSSWMRLQESTALPLERVTTYLRVHCSALVTMPSMASFYFWSRLSPPPGFVLPDGGLWLAPSYQRLVLPAIDRAQGLCVVFSPSIVAVYHQGSSLPERGALVRELDGGFRTAARVGIYVIEVRAGRDHGT